MGTVKNKISNHTSQIFIVSEVGKTYVFSENSSTEEKHQTEDLKNQNYLENQQKQYELWNHSSHFIRGV